MATGDKKKAVPKEHHVLHIDEPEASLRINDMHHMSCLEAGNGDVKKKTVLQDTT